MLSRDENTQLVLSIINDRLFFIEVEPKPSIRLLTAGEVRLKSPFTAESAQSPQLVSQYSDNINKIIDRFAIAASSAIFLLDQKLALIRRVKIDRDLNQEAVGRHINWEMEQFLTSPRHEFHINYERVSYQRDHFDYLIVAAVRKTIIHFIMEIFKKTPLSLKVLEINILAGVKGLFDFEYIEAMPEFSVVIAFEEQAIQIILIKEKSYVKHVELNGNAFKKDIANSQSAEELASLINDKINELIDAMGDEILLKNVEHFYLLNGRAHVKILSALQKLQRSAKMHFIEPLKNVKHSLSIEEESIIAANSMSFISLLGALQQ